MNKTKVFVGILIFLILTGCASYRTDSDLEFSSTDVGPMDSSFQILEGDLVGSPYAVVGPVEATVSKLTAFHKDPTKEQVNVALFQKAVLMGANAVINVEYKEGIGLWTWGYMEAKGTAVKTPVNQTGVVDEVKDPQSNLQYMGIAAEEITSKKYDKVLWVKALSLAEGDTEKQKGIYINLRSNQLAAYSTNSNSNNGSAGNENRLVDISGTFISETTASGSANYTISFIKKIDRQLIVLKQTGNTITGNDSSRKFEIIGSQEGNIIKFYILRGNEIEGTWKINADASKITGKWKTNGGGGASGNWNLTKIE